MNLMNIHDTLCLVLYSEVYIVHMFVNKTSVPSMLLVLIIVAVYQPQL